MIERWSGMFPGPSLLLCTYQFLISFKPSEPHLVPFLIEVKSFTNEQVDHDIFPYWTYTYFIATALSTMAVQILGFKNVIVIGSLCRLATRLLLLYGHSLLEMQLMQLAFGVANATDLNVVFGAYIFTLVRPKDFQKIVSATHAANLLGHVVSGELGQIMLMMKMSLTSLFYVSLITVGSATLLSLFLPSSGEYLVEEHAAEEDMEETVGKQKPLGMMSWEDFNWNSVRHLYEQYPLMKLSVIWILTSNIHQYTDNYSTVLFQEIAPDIDQNGHVDALASVLGMLASILATYIETPALKLGFLFYFSMIFGLSAILACMVFAGGIWSSWIGYIACVAFWQLTYCILLAQCGHCVKDGMYSFLFGINTTCGLALSSAYQLMVQFLGRSILIGFTVLSAYSGLVTALIAWMVSAHHRRCGRFSLVGTHAEADGISFESIKNNENETDLQHDVEILPLRAPLETGTDRSSPM